MLIGSISIYTILRLINKSNTSDENDSEIVETRNGDVLKMQDNGSSTKWLILSNVAKILSLATLCVVATIQPSVLSFIYFLVFLGAITWWGCNQELERYFFLFCENIYN
jgi:hypothetical protein